MGALKSPYLAFASSSDTRSESITSSPDYQPAGVATGYGVEAKTQWCAAHPPALGARGYPVSAILWHGLIRPDRHVAVQNLLPGRRVTALDGPMLDAALRLVELQADAGIPAGNRALPDQRRAAVSRIAALSCSEDV
ncbi:MAG: hypothetical protein ACTHJW_01275 [Streptosporangiaceae bacterium]